MINSARESVLEWMNFRGSRCMGSWLVGARGKSSRDNQHYHNDYHDEADGCCGVLDWLIYVVWLYYHYYSGFTYKSFPDIWDKELVLFILSGEEDEAGCVESSVGDKKE